MNNVNLLTITSTSDVISELTKLNTEGISLSAPIRLDSPADVLDAPLNPDEVIQGLEIIKIVFETSTAALVFSDVLIKALQKHKAKATVKKNSPNSDPVTIDADSSTEEVERVIEE